MVVKRVKYNFTGLKDESAAKQYQIQLPNRYDVLSRIKDLEHGTIDVEWTQHHGITSGTCDEILKVTKGEGTKESTTTKGKAPARKKSNGKLLTAQTK